MKNVTRLAVAALSATTVALASAPAHAGDSTRGAFYVQAAPIGFANITQCVDVVLPDSFGVLHTQSVCGTAGAYRAAAEFGYHFSGRHDGFVLGARQTFWFYSGGTAGVTQARLGWDIPIAIKDFELTIAPYGLLGVSYALSGGGNASFTFGAGVEGKFFFMKPDSGANGLYAFVQPIELGGAAGGGFSGFVYQFAAGAGYAF